MATEKQGNDTHDGDDINYVLVRALINGAALAVVGGLGAMVVAILLTID